LVALETFALSSAGRDEQCAGLASFESLVDEDIGLTLNMILGVLVTEVLVGSDLSGCSMINGTSELSGSGLLSSSRGGCGGATVLWRVLAILEFVDGES
jgi:hypothetical protein